MGVKKTLGTIGGVLGAVGAEALAVALPGPLGATASAMLKKALGKEGATDEELQAIIAGATPEQLIAIKQAEQEFQRFLAEHEIKLVEADNTDRASAREREKALKDWTPTVLAAAVTVGFFSVLLYMLRFGLPDEGREPLLIMLGSLGTAWTGIIAYYFGSSAGSKRKSDMLEGRTVKP